MAVSKAQLRASKKYCKERTSMINCRVPKELGEEFEKKCARMGVGKATMLRIMIEKFVKEG